MSSTAVRQESGVPGRGALAISSPGLPSSGRSDAIVSQALVELEETLAQLRSGILRLAAAERATRATMRAGVGSGEDGVALHSREVRPRANNEAPTDILRRIDPAEARPNAADLARLLRDHIAAATFAGTIGPGTRLPSIREVARHFGVNHKTAGRVYEALSADGVLDLRPRSGAYVGQAGYPPADSPGAPDWCARILADAAERPAGVASLPELIDPLLRTKELSCACVDATEDLRVGLTSELRHRFGVRVYPLRWEEQPAGETARDDRRARDLESVDFIVTTPWHTSVWRIARQIGKPVAVVIPDSSNVAVIADRIASSPLQIVCVDSAFGARLRCLHAPGHRDRLRVFPLDRAAILERLEPSLPIVVSEAARAVLPDDRLPAALPLSAHLGPASRLEIARLIAGLIHRS